MTAAAERRARVVAVERELKKIGKAPCLWRNPAMMLDLRKEHGEDSPVWLAY